MAQQEYTTGSGNFTAQVTGNHTITLVGGGGGGAGGYLNANKSGGGGGGGGGVVVKVVSLTASSDYAYVVGGTAAGGASRGSDGTDGNNTTFNDGATTYTASGGIGGHAASDQVGGAGGTGTNGDSNYTGGAGADGTSTYGGGGGGAAGDTGNGDGAVADAAGSGTADYGGAGGAGSTANSGPGTAATANYGGGGGAGTKNGAGGGGMSGYVLIEWVDAPAALEIDVFDSSAVTDDSTVLIPTLKINVSDTTVATDAVQGIESYMTMFGFRWADNSDSANTFSGGVLTSSGTPTQDPASFIALGSEGIAQDKIQLTAKVRYTTSGGWDTRRGVGIGSITDFGGIRGLIRDTQTLIFLEDGESWGPSSTELGSTSGEWWWIVMRRDGTSWSLMAWEDGTARPDDWQETWTRTLDAGDERFSLTVPAGSTNSNISISDFRWAWYIDAVYDDVTVTDDSTVVVNTPAPATLSIDVFDTAVATDDSTVLIPKLLINVFDTATATDDSTVMIPIKIKPFEAEDISETSGSISVGFGDNVRLYAMQSFHPAVSVITAISFDITSVPGSDDIIVYFDTSTSDEPDNTLISGAIYTFTIDNGDISTGMTKYDLPVPLSVVPGNEYCFYLRHSSDAEYRDYVSSNSNPYSDGMRRHYNNSSSEWDTPDSGNLDFNFKVHGEKGPVEAVVVTDAVQDIQISTPVGGLSINVFDTTTVTDAVQDIYLDPLLINVFDSSVVTDASTVLIPTLKINVFDASAVTDDSTVVANNPDPRTINVYDESAVTDDSTVVANNPDPRTINVFDGSAVTDVVVKLAFDPLLINVFDTAVATDEVTVSMSDDKTIDVFDTAIATDASTVLIPKLYIDVFDSSVVTDAVLDIYLDPLLIDVSDESAVTDSSTVLIPTLKINVSDTTVASDAVLDIRFDPLLINVFDESAVTDGSTVVSTQDIVIDVSDSTAVTDAVLDIFLDPLLINVFDSAVATDASSVLIPTLKIDVFDESAVTDNSTVATGEKPAFEIDVFDQSAVTDDSTVTVFGAALSINVFDTAIATDASTVFIPNLYINVYDSSAVTDSSTVVSFQETYQINVFDSSAVTDASTVSATDLHLTNTPLYIDVGGGLSIRLDDSSLSEWSNAGRPTGVRGMTGLNKQTDQVEIFDGNQWLEANMVPDGDIGYYLGAMYTNSTIAVTISDSNPTEIGDTWTSGLLNGVTFGSSHYLDVGASGAGRYLITWDISVAQNTPTAQIEVEAGIMINGSAQTPGRAHRTIANSTDVGSMGGRAILDLTANQQVSLFVLNETNTTDLDVEHANLAITQIDET